MESAPARRSTVLTLAGVLVAALAVGCGESSSSGSETPHETGTEQTTGRVTVSATRYSIARTRTCLENVGLAPGPVEKTDSRLQALADLAQRTSFSVHTSGKVVALAFGDVLLLSDLLAVPNDPYRIETRGNVLLMYRPDARRQASLVRGCLRP